MIEVIQVIFNLENILEFLNTKQYRRFEFNTSNFTSLGWINNLFYRKGKKIPNYISEYLTPLALAVWIMEDGGWTQ